MFINFSNVHAPWAERLVSICFSETLNGEMFMLWVFKGAGIEFVVTTRPPLLRECSFRCYWWCACRWIRPWHKLCPLWQQWQSCYVASSYSNRLPRPSYLSRNVRRRRVYERHCCRQLHKYDPCSKLSWSPSEDSPWTYSTSIYQIWYRTLRSYSGHRHHWSRQRWKSGILSGLLTASCNIEIIILT